jgi:hypothetical protein
MTFKQRLRSSEFRQNFVVGHGSAFPGYGPE